MKPKLREEDRRALDLLLDRGPVAAGKTGPVFAAADGNVRERVTRVQRVLQLLDVMPAAEPPRDLVSRTLKFVETAQRTGRAVRPSRGMVPTLANQPPVA